MAAPTTVPTIWREPIELAAGDTLAFTRNLSDYPASQGWSLDYELRGQSQAISFQSVANVDAHQVTVTAATTATWLAGDYILRGFAINSGTGERHQIYYGDFQLWSNAQTEAGNVPKQTFAQQMIAQIETVLLAKAGDDLAASQIGESRFQYLTPAELRTEHGYWKEVRRMEIARDRAKMGLPTGLKSRPIFKIKTPGPTAGMFGHGSGYGGW